MSFKSCLASGSMEFVTVLMTAQYVSEWDNAMIIIFIHAGLMSFFCPCVQVYRNANAISGGESGLLFFFGLFTPLNNCYNRAALRNDIRTYKGIKGSHFEDFVCTYCCFPLSLVQESRVCELFP